VNGACDDGSPFFILSDLAASGAGVWGETGELLAQARGTKPRMSARAPKAVRRSVSVIASLKRFKFEAGS
jgi:hypothetical protein